jgi:hypothetical protein
MTAWSWRSDGVAIQQRGRRDFGRDALRIAVGAGALAAMCPAALANDRLDPGRATFRDFALSNDANSLIDLRNVVNREWTENSAQTLLDVLSVDSAAGFARVKLKSVDCEMAVPLGWHGMEDHERGAIFTPDRSVRIIVWRVDLKYEGVDDLEKYVVAKQGALRARSPSIQARVRKLADGEFLSMYANVPARRNDREPRAIFDLLTPNRANPARAMLMTVGVPGSQADRYLPLVALLSRERKIAWRADF